MSGMGQQDWGAVQERIVRVLRGLGPMTTTNLLYSMRLDYPEAVVRKALSYLEGNKRITRDSQKAAWRLTE